MRAIWRWVWCCLGCAILMTGCAVSRERQIAYRDLAAWLGANALPDETVGVQESHVWGQLTRAPLVTLPSGGDAAALLGALMDARPDYCIALRSVAWQGVQAAPWFRAHYRPETEIRAASDSASPLVLYGYRPSPFDAGEVVVLDLTLEGTGVGRIGLGTLQLSTRRLAEGEPVYVSLTAWGDVREPLSAVWQLVALDGGKVWMRDVQPQLGGLSPEDWPRSGEVLEQRVIAPPEGIPPGKYALELGFLRPNLGPFGEPVQLATLSVPPDVAQVFPEPDYALELQVGEALALVGYDAPAALDVGQPLRITLYWHAKGIESRNLKAFVHVLGPDGRLVAQSDAVPVAWTYPTSAWQPGDYVRDVYILAAETGLPRGAYRIVAGMYDAETRLRVPLTDAHGVALADNLVQLGMLRVR